MKEKIAFPQLVDLVATKANTTSRMSELFLQELFDTISQALNSGETVKIKGLGTFKIKKEEGGKDILFTPDKDLAEAVNAPFAQFQPVELSEPVSNSPRLTQAWSRATSRCLKQSKNLLSKSLRANQWPKSLLNPPSRLSHRPLRMSRQQVKRCKSLKSPLPHQ